MIDAKILTIHGRCTAQVCQERSIRGGTDDEIVTPVPCEVYAAIALGNIQRKRIQELELEYQGMVEIIAILVSQAGGSAKISRGETAAIDASRLVIKKGPNVDPLSDVMILEMRPPREPEAEA